MSVKYMEYVKCFFTNEIPGILKFTPKRVNCDIFCKKNWECKIFYSSIFQQKCQFFFAKFYKVTHVISRLKISVEFKNSQKRWIFGVNSWKLRKKFQWNSKIRRKGEFLALILENYAWGQFLPCLTNSMSVYVKILLYQCNLVYLQFIRQKYHEKKHFFGTFPLYWQWQWLALPLFLPEIVEAS